VTSIYTYRLRRATRRYEEFIGAELRVVSAEK
jgi:hypothetical protein